MNKKVGEKILSLMLFLENRENFQDLLEYVFEKFYKHSLKVLNNSHEDKFLSCFLNHEHDLITYVDANTFLSYMKLYFQSTNKPELLDDEVFKILSVSKGKSLKNIDKQRRFFWIAYMRYIKNFLMFTGSDVNITRHGFFTLIGFKNEYNDYGVMNALAINNSLLEELEIETFFQLRQLNLSKQKIEAFSYKNLQILENKLNKKIEYIYELNKKLL